MGITVAEGYSLRHAYKEFKQRCREDGKVYGNITEHVYRKICNEFNEMLIKEALEGNKVVLPYSLGYLAVFKFKTPYEKAKIDFNETKKEGKTIYHFNHHSDGWYAKWSWLKRRHKYAPLEPIFYSFTPVKALRKRLSKIMFSENGHKRFTAKTIQL
jgi:hypothetical protein